MAKYNNYAEYNDDSMNRLAILDPNDAVADPVSGQSAMRPVLSIPGSSLSFSADAGSVGLDRQGPQLGTTLFKLARGIVVVAITDAGSGLDGGLRLAPSQFSVMMPGRKKPLILPASTVDPQSFSPGATSATLTLTLKKKTRGAKGLPDLIVAPGAIRDLAGNALAGVTASAVRGRHPRGHAAAFRGRSCSVMDRRPGGMLTSA